MKLYIILYYTLLFSSASNLHAIEINEKPRIWTRGDGQTARAKLVDIKDDNIHIEISGNEHVFPLSDFSEKDREYVDKVLSSLPTGKIEKFSPQFHKKNNKVFYEQHGMQSLIWNGENKEKLPLLFYQPRSVGSEKMPVIIYLHGTGGMGADNTKPFFHDGGGAAKHLLEESFQKDNPCYVITPQIKRHSGWFSAHFTDPSDEQIWLRSAIQLMAQDEKYSIDLDRIYIMGPSMGGHGVYEALAKLPDFYAAGVAIAAVDDGASFNKENVKSYLFVALNKGDKAEGVDVLKEFAAKYRRLGGRIKTLVYDKGGHNAWDKALKDKKFCTSLFKQRRE